MPNDTIKKAVAQKQSNNRFEFHKISPANFCQYDYNHNQILQNNIDIAIKNNDVVYVVIPKGHKKIVSYGWYSANPTIINDNFILQFPQNFIYMYNGYTEPEYRGYRLHAFGMQYASIDATQLGRKGLVSFVNIENYRSIRSCKRAGYQFVGFIVIFKILSKYYILRSPNIKNMNIDLIGCHQSHNDDYANFKNIL
jgi:hypothetical protein